MRLVLMLLALVFALTAPARAINLKVEPGRIIMADRLYGDRDYDALVIALNANPHIRTVLMRNFYGGLNLSTIIGVANLIRERGLATEVSGACVSACAIAFLGGVRRRTAADANPQGTYVAFHGAYRRGLVASDWESTVSSAVRRLTGGRMSEALIKDAYNLDQDGFLAFYDGKRYRRPDGTSVFRCAGTERKKTHDCPGIKGIDGISQGVFTP